VISEFYGLIVLVDTGVSAKPFATIHHQLMAGYEGRAV
jgi:hypothetical protein